MALSLLLACIILAAISIHAAIVLLKHKRTPSLPLPPGPLRLPLVGNAIYFFVALRGSPHRALARFNERYGPVASLRPGMMPTFVIVSSPAAAREALAGNDAAIAARFVPDNTRGLAHHAGSVFLLPSSSPLWKQYRINIGAHVSTGRSLDATRAIRDRHARQLAEHVRARSGRPVAVGEVVLGAMINVISNMLFSRDLVDLRTPEGGARLLLFKESITGITEGWAKPNISDVFPFLAWLDLSGSRRCVSRHMAKLYRIIDEEVTESRLASGKNHGDLLDVVLERYAKSQITRADISKFFADVFIAGTDTSTLTVGWAIARLLRHPDKLEKVHAELAANLSSKDFVEESDLGKLPYLHAVVKETMRLHPSLPVLPREVVADGVSLGGFSVPKGSSIFINLWAMGRDPAVWSEPEEFIPERFLGDRVINFRGSNFAFIPFGAGRRVCPGMEMAARFVPLVLASILHKIEWKLPDSMGPEDVDVREHCAIVLEPLTPFRAIPVSTA